MAQHNLPLFGLPLLQIPPPVQLQPNEPRLSMMFNDTLGSARSLQYRQAARDIEQEYIGVINNANMYIRIKNLQLSYANMIVDAEKRDRAISLSNQHFQSVLRRENAALNNNQ